MGGGEREGIVRGDGGWNWVGEEVVLVMEGLEEVVAVVVVVKLLR